MIDESKIFGIAAALPPEERPSYLDLSCTGHPEARARLEEQLRLHDVEGFTESQTFRFPSIQAEPASLKPGAAGERIGFYKLLEQIGEGGFGTVWAAEQSQPIRRRVALKIIKPGMDTREVIARFGQERQALALMDHPNIAKVLDAGSTSWGRPYFVMELVRGIRITDYCDQANLPTAERLALFIQVCHAVQHAHQKGIIHRDLKPSNILVTLQDGVPVPKVIDFGVAKATQQQRLTDLTIYTRIQQMIGTPLYMSPEQAEMSGLDIDTRSDIYSLGVLLYELLTGRTPFDPVVLMREGLDEIRRVIREQEPQTPSMFVSKMTEQFRGPVAQRRQADGAKLAGLLRGDLDCVVMKALEKDRTRRYQSADELALDLKRHLAHEPVIARPATALHRFRRLVRRNRLAFTAGLVATALLVGTIFSTFSWKRERAQRRETDLQREKAVQLEHRSLRTEGLAGGRTSALAALRAAWAISPSAELRNEAIACLALHEVQFAKTLPPDDPLARPPEPGASADGRWVLRFENNALEVLERASGRHVAQFPDLPGRPPAQLDDMGRRLAIVRDAKDVTLHELPSGRLLHKLPHPQPVSCLDWTGELLATGGGYDRLIHLWDTTTGKRLRRFSGHDSHIEALRFRPGGQELISLAQDSVLRVWHAARGVEILRVEGVVNHRGPAWWSADGREFFCPQALSGKVDVFQCDWSRTTQVLAPGEDEPRSENVPSLVLDGTGELAAAVDETACRVWSLAAGRLAATFPKDGQEWMAVQFAGDDSLWLSGWNRALRRVPVVRQRRGWPEFAAEEHTGLRSGPLLVGARADGGALALTANEQTDAADRVEIYYPGEKRAVRLAQRDPFSAALSPDGRWGATGSFRDPGARLWHLPSGEPARTISHPDTVLGLFFAGGNLWLVSPTGVQRTSPNSAPADGVTIPGNFPGFTVSPDGRHAASLARTEVVLHRQSDLAKIARFPVPAYAGAIGSGTLAFSRDGAHLALHTAGGTVITWRLETLRAELRALGMDW
ncbi:MAG: serine/threonine protein kinase [Verrucomicrobiales bacterium]|nr:serine/threonine protein kinase [Verrucomicrobiales bacterium]